MHINRKRAVALLDSGSTTSFLSQDFAVKCNCDLIPVKPRAIAVAGGGKLMSTTVAPKCAFQLAKLKFCHDFRVLPLPSHDMILGYDWFAIASHVAFNIPENIFSFTFQGKQTISTAIYNNAATVKEVPAKTTSKILEKGAEGFCFKCTI